MPEPVPETDPASEARPGGRVSRRRFLVSAATVTGAAAVGGIAGFGLGRATAASDAGVVDRDAVVSFDGAHQAGIVTPAQDRMAFAAFDLTTTSRAEVAALLAVWTNAARRMTAGLPVGDVGGNPLGPPVDTGEAVGLGPSRLTVTVGFGPGLFDRRFGLSGRRPAALTDLPRFPGDLLQDELSGGDLAIQACADDPQVAFHATRNLARLARGAAVVRWLQLGFSRDASTSSAQATPRNLMGFKDGTNNVVAEDTDAVNRFVWVEGGDQPWMRGGSYLVARRIRMRIESWDRTTLDEQERVIGRTKVVGAPIGRSGEFDAVPLDEAGADGESVIAEDAHIRLAAPASNDGERILRRGYSFSDGIVQRTGELDAGLFFICFQRDPASQFVAIQRRLSGIDALNEYIRHTGSAVFACPPGTRPGEPWGTALLG